MHRIANAVRLLLVLVAGLGFAVETHACSCAGPGSPGQAFAQSTAVFRGRILPREPRTLRAGGRVIPLYDPIWILEVSKVWKGAKASRIEVNVDVCGFQGFASGKEYLVYAYGSPTLSASMCSRTKLIGEGRNSAMVEMLALDALAQGKKEEVFLRTLPDLVLRDSRAAMRAEAARLLSSYGLKALSAEDISSTLLLAVEDKEGVVREAAIIGLDPARSRWIAEGMMPVIAKALVTRLADREPSVRREAATAMRFYGRYDGTESGLVAALEAERNRQQPDDTVLTALSSTIATIGRPQFKKQVVPLLLADLRSRDVAVRRNAAQKLGEIGPYAVSAVSGLLAALRDPDEWLRYYSADALGSIGSRQALAGLTAALRDKKVNVRARAALAIYHIGDEKTLHEVAIPVLIETLRRQPGFDSYHLIPVLGEMGPSAQRAVPALIEALKSAAGYQIGPVAQALGNIGGRADQAVPALLEALPRADESARWMIIRSLTAIGDSSTPVVHALEQMLSDPASSVRWSAAETLVQWGRLSGASNVRKRIVPELLHDLKSADLEKRRRAANELRRWGTLAEAAVGPLTGTLSDPDRWVRSYSATALGSIGPASAPAVSSLTTLLRDKEVRREAVVALGRIGAKASPAVPSILPLLQSDDSWTPYCAAEALQRIGTRDARDAFRAFAETRIPILVTWLRDQSRKDRGEAARFLVHLAPQTTRAIDSLLLALTDSDWLTRAKAVEALGALGAAGERAVPSLAQVLRDRHPLVRAAASTALADIGTPQARRALAE